MNSTQHTSAEALVANNRLREQMILRGVQLAEKIKEVRARADRPTIACLPAGGGLAICWIRQESQYMFRGLDHEGVHLNPDATLVKSWNRHHPDHQVVVRPWLDALLDSAADIWIFMSSIEQGRQRLESAQ